MSRRKQRFPSHFAGEVSVANLCQKLVPTLSAQRKEQSTEENSVDGGEQTCCDSTECSDNSLPSVTVDTITSAMTELHKPMNYLPSCNKPKENSRKNKLNAKKTLRNFRIHSEINTAVTHSVPPTSYNQTQNEIMKTHSSDFSSEEREGSTPREKDNTATQTEIAEPSNSPTYSTPSMNLHSNQTDHSIKGPQDIPNDNNTEANSDHRSVVAKSLCSSDLVHSRGETSERRCLLSSLVGTSTVPETENFKSVLLYSSPVTSTPPAKASDEANVMCIINNLNQNVLASNEHTSKTAKRESSGFICPVCQECFKSKRSFNSHILVHCQLVKTPNQSSKRGSLSLDHCNENASKKMSNGSENGFNENCDFRLMKPTAEATFPLDLSFKKSDHFCWTDQSSSHLRENSSSQSSSSLSSFRDSPTSEIHDNDHKLVDQRQSEDQAQLMNHCHSVDYSQSIHRNQSTELFLSVDQSQSVEGCHSVNQNQYMYHSQSMDQNHLTDHSLSTSPSDQNLSVLLDRSPLEDETENLANEAREQEKAFFDTAQNEPFLSEDSTGLDPPPPLPMYNTGGIKKRVKVCSDDGPPMVYRIKLHAEQIFVSRILGMNEETGDKLELYKCFMCALSFSSVSRLQAHLSVHKQRFVCRKCSYSCDSRIQFSQHVQREHIARETLREKTRCSIEAYEDSNNAENTVTVAALLSALHGNNPEQKKTEETGNGEGEESMGPKEEEEEERRSEESSSYPTSPTSELQMDMGDISDQSNGVNDIFKMFSCRFCGKKFDRAFSCNRHERVHTGYKPCFCRICGRGFSEPRNLRHHVIRFHSDGSLRHLIKRDRRKRKEEPPSNSQLRDVKEVLKECGNQEPKSIFGTLLIGSRPDYTSTTCQNSFLISDAAVRGVRNGSSNGFDLQEQLNSSRSEAVNTYTSNLTKIFAASLDNSTRYKKPDLPSVQTKETSLLGISEKSPCQRVEMGDLMDQLEPGEIRLNRRTKIIDDGEKGRRLIIADDTSEDGLDHSPQFSSYAPRLNIVQEPVKREEILIPITDDIGRTFYECPYCQKLFGSTSDLNRHLDFHEDLRPYECKYCEYSARTNSQLKVHKMRHEGIKQFSCDVCNYNGVTQSDLNRHKKTQSHIARSQNVCPMCGLGFYSSSQKQVHITKCHPEMEGASSLIQMSLGIPPAPSPNSLTPPSNPMITTSNHFISTSNSMMFTTTSLLPTSIPLIASSDPLVTISNPFMHASSPLMPTSNILIPTSNQLVGLQTPNHLIPTSDSLIATTIPASFINTTSQSTLCTKLQENSMRTTDFSAHSDDVASSGLGMDDQASSGPGMDDQASSESGMDEEASSAPGMNNQASSGDIVNSGLNNSLRAVTTISDERLRLSPEPSSG